MKTLYNGGLSLLLVLAVSVAGSAQMYDSAAGLRGGTGATISFKKFLGNAVAVEGIVGSFNRDAIYNYFGTGILFEVHTDANLGRLQWYWGAGPYLTFTKDFTGFGAIGAVGMDYSFESIPIDITLDWTPRLRIAGASGKLFTRSAGVGLRYIIAY